MRTQRLRITLPVLLGIVLVMTAPDVVNATEWTVTLTIANGGDANQELVFGIHPDGTYGVDPQLGEVGLPPWPPTAVFDARFLIDGIEGLRRDIRDDSETERTHKIQWQPGSGGYPVVIRWDRVSLPAATLTMQDGYTGILIPPFDMSAADSLVIPPEQSYIKRVDIVVRPGQVPPSPPVITPPIPDLHIFQGQQFPELNLDDFVSDPDDLVEDLQWIITGDSPPWPTISDDRVVIFEVPSDWTGSRELHLRVVDPGGLEDAQDFTVSAVAGGLPSWSFGLTLENGFADVQQTYLGLHPNATDGIDPALGEVALPPWPPSDVFDGRMLLPDNLTHSQRDIRFSAVGAVEYHLQWQAGDGGYPVTVSWPADLPLGDFFIRDDLTGIFLPPLDMRSTQQLVVPDSLSFVTGLIVSANAVIDTIPPQGPFNFRKLTQTESEVTLTWDIAIEEHFAYYEILYDTTAFDDQATFVWDWTEDGALLDINTTQTTIPFPGGMLPLFFKIRAWDTFGNVGPLSDLEIVTAVRNECDHWLPAGPTILGVHPNPFSQTISISCRMAEGEGGKLTVYDLSGRRVATLPIASRNDASQLVQWNGLDNSGRKVASGTYLCILKTPRGSDRKRILFLK